MGIEKGWEAIRRMQAVSDEEVNSMKRLVMTTDTKADQMDQYTSSSGRVWVPLADHERVVGELQGTAWEMVESAQTRNVELAEEICDLKNALAASRAEVEGLKKDAERYRWLRDADKYPNPVGGLWNLLGETSEPIEMDEKIDAAMENNNV